MSEKSFEAYGKRASANLAPVEVAGRYPSMQLAERRLISDVVSKLSLQPEDVCRDIGCNVGNLFIPLSFFVTSMTGIDHAVCLEKLSQRYAGNNISLISGNFLTCEIPSGQTFDKVLVYSVLHYLAADELYPFITKALSLVRPGGRMLLGDIPNQSCKKRFLESEKGRQYDLEWRQNPDNAYSVSHKNLCAEVGKDNDCVVFDDAVMLDILLFIRNSGFRAYILPQDEEFPFGHTREDILIVRPS